MRADTVVDALADRLGVSKGDILDREGVSFMKRGKNSVLGTWDLGLETGAPLCPSHPCEVLDR